MPTRKAPRRIVPSTVTGQARDARRLAEFVSRGTGLHRDGRFREAAECFRQALGYAPKCLAALTGLGSALWALGRHAEAVTCFEEAVAAEPGDAHAAACLADAYLLGGQRWAAEKYYLQATAGDPTRAAVLARVGGPLRVA
jgi:tetratricopeptide (TPR) repeat protein